MQKNLALVVGAMVFAIIAFLIVTLNQSGLSDTQSTADRIDRQGCTYQEDQVLDPRYTEDGHNPDAGRQEAMNSRCNDQDFQNTEENLRVTDALNQ
jgi:hypothetical protein